MCMNRRREIMHWGERERAQRDVEVDSGDNMIPVHRCQVRLLSERT